MQMTLGQIQSALDKLKLNSTETEWCPDNNFDGETLNAFEEALTQALEIAKGEKVVVPKEPTDTITDAIIATGLVSDYANGSDWQKACELYDVMIAVVEGDK
jgi:hypothetical protein